MPENPAQHRPNGRPLVSTDAALPPPTQTQREHHAALVRLICERAAAGGIDFAHYMELALYAPGLGYYRGGAQKFGADGDFVTAAELSPLFAYCLAKQFHQILAHLGGGDLLEVGAGSGALAVELLRELERLDSLPRRYLILELSAELQRRQATLIRRALPHLHTRVHWLQTLPATPLRGVIFANELLDAMPVTRFRASEQGIEQLRVVCKDGHFKWCGQPASEAVRQRVQTLALPIPYISEINLAAEAWVHSIAEYLQAGVLLLIDYGFPRAEFYHPQRNQGTLMCHYQHRAHDDPLILTGLQDITAHIDFTAIAEAGFDAGLSVLGYTSQAAFLLSNGLDELAGTSGATGAREHMGLARQINTLTSPAEMGELYKVIAFGRDIDITLQGFSLNDRRGRL
jgi:SAM-dependent MidA family methyltransferase